MATPNSLRAGRVFACLVALLVVCCGAAVAEAQQVYRLSDGGKLRDLTVAADEIQVIKAGAAAADLAREIETRTPGAKVLESEKGRALVKVAGRGASKADAVALKGALPGMEVEAVLYPAGAAHDKLTRRIATADVLVQVPAGETAAGVAAETGATGTQPVPLAGHVMLHFASGFHALEAAESLRARGVTTEVQLRRQHAVRSVPNDPFFPNQWHLRNTGQGGGVVGVDANVTDAWDITKGSGVTISVVDESLQTLHPDLTANCPPISSNFHRDFNGGDNDPAPEAGDEHGTSVGGVAAGKGNNGIGISGSAPDAQLVGIRLISGPSTDLEDATALYWHPTGLTVGASNNSWGPTVYYAGADVLAKQALADATSFGRGGLGQVTLFAGGNSQSAANGSRDSNADSFANSRYVIGVGASNNFGEQCTYSQRGANLLVCAPSSDPFNVNPRLGIWTTDDVGAAGYNPGAGEPADTNYTNSFGGTSSATPLVTGCVALMLAANPNLGWRDVHEIVAATAEQLQPGDGDWVLNGGGFKFNHKFGGGMINATAAVVRGLDWDNLGPEITQSKTLLSGLPVTIPDGSGAINRTFDFSTGANLRVERAEIVLKITHAHRSDLEITLTSPSGTTSILSQLRPRPSSGDFYDDDSNIEDNGQGWTFTTTHCWGENSTEDTGLWTLSVRDLRSGTTGTLDAATVRLFGTTAPLERVAFELPAYTVGEADGTVTVRVNRVGNATGPFSVDLITSTHGTATDGQDFVAVTQTLNFADSEPFQDIDVTIKQDSVPEPIETVYLLLKNASGVALGGVPLATIKIVDDETRPVTIVATDSEAAETTALQVPNTGTFTISRAAADPTPLTVNLLIGGTATGGPTAAFDYKPALPSTVTIPAFATSTTLTVTPNDDATLEGSETVDVTILPSVDYDVGTPSMATVLIRDNDLPPVNITAQVSSVPEDSATPVNFLVSRGVADVNPLLVKLMTEGTARPGDNYVPLPQQVEIPSGAVSVLVPLQPKNDDIYIPLKTVVLRLVPSPDYTEGFNTSAMISITENDPLPDPKVPVVKITSPKNKARVNAPNTVTASGTAADNISVAVVFYQVNNNPTHPATGTNSWTADLTSELIHGPNTLTVFSKDGDGNLSKPARVTLDYVQPRTLTLDLMTNGAPGAGGGSVSKGFAPQASLEAGQLYTVEAKANAGFSFSGWSGDLTAPARPFTFVMPDANTHLVASFVTDPFSGAITGVYTGPVRTGAAGAVAFDFASCGLLQIMLNPKGSCTGKLYLGGEKVTLKGEFNGQGRFKTTVQRKKGTPIDLDLVVDLNGMNHTINGSVTTPDFTATASAERAGFSKTVPYPLAPAHPKAETYNFQLPAPNGLGISDPHGRGYGSFAIDAAGKVKWRATLRDGEKTGGTVPLNKDGSWLLFASLYHDRGVILGRVTTDKMPAIPATAAVVDWAKIPIPADPKQPSFRSGFKRLAETGIGCLYTPPGRDAAFSAFGSAAVASGPLTLEEGNLALPAPFVRTITVPPGNKALVDDGPSPKLAVTIKIDAAKGTFTGSFIDPKFTAKKTSLSFGGVILLDVSSGFGGFSGETINGTGLQTGSVKIDLH